MGQNVKPFFGQNNRFVTRQNTIVTAKPRYFQNISPSVQYENNLKAWMTSALFEEILHKWDEK